MLIANFPQNSCNNVLNPATRTLHMLSQVKQPKTQMDQWNVGRRVGPYVLAGDRQLKLLPNLRSAKTEI